MDFATIPPSPAHPLQNMHELRQLWEHVAAHPHHRVLEIGSLYGGTLWHWSHLPDVRRLVSIDLPTEWPTAAHDARSARSHWHEWFSPLVEFIDISADSQAATTIEIARGLGPFDFAFIDGDHSYEGVRADWHAYSPLVRPGGIVAFHDTWPNHDRHEPGVVRWVDELRHHLPSIEWTDPDGVGIAAFTTPALP